MALEKITHVSGTGIFYPGDDIDTDQIIPARFMKCITFDGLGEYAFFDIRKAEDGADKPGVVFNDPRFKDASVLITGSNFGCGSSREHAPQSLYRYGIRAIIAESFAEIFFGNATNLSLPCVSIAPEEIAVLGKMVNDDPNLMVELDLDAKTVTAGGQTFAMNIAESARSSLVAGRWDTIAELLEGKEEVDKLAASLAYVN